MITELPLKNWFEWYLRFPMQEYTVSSILEDNEMKEGYD